MAWKDLPFFLDRSVTGYEATLTSPTFDVQGFSKLQLAVSVSYMSGIDSSLWVYLDTSMDGVNWVSIYEQEFTSTAMPALDSGTQDQILRFVRSRIYMDEDHADPQKPQTAVISVKGIATD